MKTNASYFFLSCTFIAAATLIAATGPFDPEAWPPTVDPNKLVHYVVTEGTLTPPEGAFWQEGVLQILTGGDQSTENFNIGGHIGKKAVSDYLNVADWAWTDWASVETIDILVQAYGDAALLDADGEPQDFTFLTGTLPFPRLRWAVGGQIPVDAKNGKWNWVLFRIDNPQRADDGGRYVGTLPPDSTEANEYGGVNHGTIRFENVSQLIVRVIAFGEGGAFGEPDEINHFLPAESCDPEPNTNLAGIDIDAGTANHVEVLDGHDHTTTIVEDVGPADDKRRAVVPNGLYLNFGITDNYLGQPCNEPRTVKVCLDFYDDPAFAGLNVRFGPEAFATDALPTYDFYPADRRQILTGSDKWIRRSWVIRGVNLKGVNADTFTAGPRFCSENGQVAVSRFEIAVLRVGDHPLAGQDPLADCIEDPNICTDAYASYVELDLANDIRNGLDLGSNQGDQEYVLEEAGPVNDRRMAVRAAHDDGDATHEDKYLNFAITGQALGPSTQPNAHLAICVTYYDDPALVGTQFRPEVYQTDDGGTLTLKWTPPSFFVQLEGTGQWNEAYWEITDVKFKGVNQDPQAAARFVTANAEGVKAKIPITRVRYAVIRPCGPNAGVNLLEDCKPPEPVLGVRRGFEQVEIYWSTRLQGWTLQQNSDLNDTGAWAPVMTEPVIEDNQNVVKENVGAAPSFYRLAK